MVLIPDMEVITKEAFKRPRATMSRVARCERKRPILSVRHLLWRRLSLTPAAYASPILRLTFSLTLILVLPASVAAFADVFYARELGRQPRRQFCPQQAAVGLPAC